MPDYECWLLWREDSVGNADPATLEFTDDLRGRLVRWARQYDNTLVPHDPASSLRVSHRRTWKMPSREGRSLAVDLRREIGARATVRYWRDQT